MPREDHDQEFKALIQAFLREFIRLFFPEWYERFDFDHVEWLDKEIFLDPPRGKTRNLDLVARVPVRQVVPSQRSGEPDRWIVLIHIEVEADDRITRLRPRMYDYYKGLRDRYHLPVWSLALYLHVGLEGVGWDVYEEHLWERLVLHFEYPYVGLPGLNAEEYANGESLLGVALSAMMRVPKERRLELVMHDLQRVAESRENDVRRNLLAGFVAKYRNLDEAQEQEFKRILETEQFRGVKVMTTTWHEQGERKILERQLQKRFGPLSDKVRERLAALSAERLEELAEAILDAKSLKDLGLED
ncbi:MAG TPA: DUF4351 domain-containing protein [Gemmataceae bacterium]|nr:DUF4351 domain-containing protein [Gemmataceae bacterium]